MIIGKWNGSVALTYLGVAAACFGIASCSAGNNDIACVCLMIAGICDLFDGYVARAMKRTEDEKEFGIELDSLADVISFVALPVMIVLSYGFSWFNILASIAFCICGVARLAFFNKDAKKKDGAVKFYHGLPVTFTALILPVGYVFARSFEMANMKDFLSIIIAIIAFLNIYDFKIPKPRGIAYGVFCGIALALITLLIAL